MQKSYFFISTLILASLLAGCALSSQPIEVKTLEVASSPTDPVLPSTELSNLYLNCLSSALKMNEARAAHTATLLPDGRVLVAGGFREEGTAEIAISSAEIFDPKTNTFTAISDLNAPRNGHTATLLQNGQVLIAGGWDQSGRTSTAEIYDSQTAEERSGVDRGWRLCPEYPATDC